jgi:SAM-dependent methyltransferase
LRFIFNAAGVRGRAEEFYRNAYSLRMHSTSAKSLNFSSATPTPVAELQLAFLSETVRNAQGTMLEVGAGKGEFLSRFVMARPEWRIAAIEPSSAAATLAQRVPSAEVHQGPYATFTAFGFFDVIVCLGVIEHVQRPVELLEWMGARFSPGGVLLLSLPNFEANPNDLFCVDHLSKLTLSSLEMIAGRAGLAILRTHPIGVGFMAIMRPAGGPTSKTSVFGHTLAVARRNEALARQTIEAIDHARSAAGGLGFAIFGLNIAGLFTPLFRDFDPQEIMAYVDENETMHGAEINDRPVVGFPALRTLGVGHVAIAASPVYHDQIKAKLMPFAVTVHA